ncbi:MAG: GtrA family protein, partial [Bifidobacteriaceae bacterium]|nr:GtrA family protein [Bifidobacteriaceae bacterium]
MRSHPSQPVPPSQRPWARLVAFVAVGAASAAVDMGLFLVLERLGLPAWGASACSFLAAFAVNYRGNRDLVFRAGAVLGALRRYVGLVGFNWVASTLLVGVLAAAGLPGWVAKGASMVAVAAFNYVALRRWVFRVGGPARTGVDQAGVDQTGGDHAVGGQAVGGALGAAGTRPSKRGPVPAATLAYWMVIAAEFAIALFAAVRIHVMLAPDSLYYYGRALLYTGFTREEAFATANAAGRVINAHVPSVERMFDWNLVEPRVVYPALSAPFVRLMGLNGMLVVSGGATALLFGLMAWALRRRYGTVPALAAMTLLLASYTWFYQAVAPITESLSALWFALALGAAWRSRTWAHAPSAPRRRFAPMVFPRGRLAASRASGASPTIATGARLAAHPAQKAHSRHEFPVRDTVGRGRRWLWLAAAVACTALFAFTRQAALRPAGALFVAWLGEWARTKRPRNSWLAPAVAIVGTSALCQVWQLLAFPYDPRGEWLAQTGGDTQSLGGIIIRGLAVVKKGLVGFAEADQAMAMSVLLLAV